jgi:hypothetical protein
MWTSQVSAGWVIDQVIKEKEWHQQVIVQENHIKVTVLNKKKIPKNAVIMNLDTETITQVDYDSEQYTAAALQEYGQLLQTLQSSVLPAMAEVMKRGQGQLKALSPEQRGTIEQMLGSQSPTAGQAASDCPEPPPTEMRKTEQKDTIAGYAARRYDLLVDQKTQSELWIAKDITISQELDAEKMARFSAELAKLATCNPTVGRRDLFSDGLSWQVINEGYPVRIVHPDDQRTVEVVKAEPRTVPDSEFQPPAGFSATPLRHMTELLRKVQKQ